MKFHKYVTPADAKTQAAWDRYSLTRNQADKPTGMGAAPTVRITNVPGGKKWKA